MVVNAETLSKLRLEQQSVSEIWQGITTISGVNEDVTIFIEEYEIPVDERLEVNVMLAVNNWALFGNKAELLAEVAQNIVKNQAQIDWPMIRSYYC